METKILALTCLLIWLFSSQVDKVQSLYPAQETVDTKFYLYTPANRLPYGERIATDNLQAIRHTTFDPTLRLTVIIHGYLQNGFKPWIKKMRKELMKKKRINIIALDWETGASTLYDTAAGNTRLVGADLAKLITELQNQFNYKSSNVHVIGHSLGAHVAGFAGAVLSMRNQTKIGRITGLDPARPGFDKDDPSLRLDPGDAQFVDVIHTDAGTNFLEGSLGLERISGHVDFYPNGGASQPGCVYVKNLEDGLSKIQRLFESSGPPSLPKTFACDHMKVIDYFTSSINHECSRKAFPCQSWEAFKEGRCFKCEGACPEMGYNADQYHVNGSHKFYLSTSDGEGYCAPQHYVSVVLSGLQSRSEFWLFNAFKSLLGNRKIAIKLIGQDNIIKTKKSIVEDDSNQISRLMLSDVRPGPLKSIVISYYGGDMYIGKATVRDGINTYTACFNQWISSFFYYSRYEAKLRRGDHNC